MGSAEAAGKGSSGQLLLLVLETKSFYEERPENSSRFSMPVLLAETPDNQLEAAGRRGALMSFRQGNCEASEPAPGLGSQLCAPVSRSPAGPRHTRAGLPGSNPRMLAPDNASGVPSFKNKF